MSEGNRYQLVIPFPTDHPEFAFGVAWEIFRQRLIRTPEPFADYVLEEIADRLHELARQYGRESFFSSTDWPGWVLMKIARAS